MNEYMSFTQFLADDGLRSLPIACRLVPFDQWLVTHVDTSWKVKDIKHWILSKCDAWGRATAPSAPRFRPPSPVTFSAPSRRSDSPTSSWGGTVEEEDEDEWDGFAAERKQALASECSLGMDSSANVSGRTLPSATSPSFYPAPRQSGSTTHEQEQAIASARYMVVSFSNGFIMDDEATFSWYKVRPFELLEIHRAGTIVSLPRHGISYTDPYFESSVRVSDRHTRKKTRSDSEQALQSHPSEWKTRWAIIREGCLYLCKDAISAPTHKFPISSLNALSSPERLGISSLSSHVVCAKFSRNSDSMGSIGDSDTVPSFQRKQKTKPGSWVIIEMPDRSSYDHFIRVLHRLAPHPLQLAHPKTPLPSPVSPSSPKQTPHSLNSLASTSGQNHAFASSSGSSAFYGVQYPEWRLALLAKARMAGRGASTSAVSMAYASSLVGDRGHGNRNGGDPELIHHILPRASSISEGLRRRAAKEKETVAESSEEDDSENVGLGASPWMDALSEEDEDDNEEEDVESEVEWEGWMHDLARKARRTPPPPLAKLDKPVRNMHRGGTSPMTPMSPSSPSSEDYDYDYAEHYGSGRTRTISYTPGDNALQRTHSSTTSAAGLMFGALPFIHTTTTTITVHDGPVPDSHMDYLLPISKVGESSMSTSTGTMMSTSPPSATFPPPSSPPLGTGTQRARRVRSPSSTSLSRTGVSSTSMPAIPILSSSPPGPGPGSTTASISGSASIGSTSGRNAGNLGGVKKIVRGMSVRNAFSAERLARKFEDTLDFGDGR